MTIAICIQCGQQKVGAFSPCSKCKFTPNTVEDLAKSLMLSDRYQGSDSLQNASQLLQLGNSLNYDSEALSGLTKDLKDIDVSKINASTKRFMRACLLGVVLLVVGLSFLVAYLRG